MAGRVASWPTYLLTGVPADHRLLISEEAEGRNTSVSDVIRSLLCDSFRLDCPPESYRYDASRDKGARTILLRLQPKLVKALDREQRRSGMNKRQIILGTIESHYTKEEA